MIFHLAIPSKDLPESLHFYEWQLRQKIGRKYPTHFVMNFYGSQVVCHLEKKDPQYDKKPKMYPRHFGVIVRDKNELMELFRKYQSAPYLFETYFVRQANKFEEHHTFFLKDPSNNLIEFKWYKNDGATFS